MSKFCQNNKKSPPLTINASVICLLKILPYLEYPLYLCINTIGRKIQVQDTLCFLIRYVSRLITFILMQSSSMTHFLDLTLSVGQVTSFKIFRLASQMYDVTPMPSSGTKACIEDMRCVQLNGACHGVVPPIPDPSIVQTPSSPAGWFEKLSELSSSD